MNARLIRCRACPRLVAHREAIAKTKRRSYLADDYWGRPVPGFGDPKAPIVILGLAPGAHGANRTGRVFTGDRSGDFLYAALHRAGLASQPTSERADDGLRLRGVFVTLAARCVPPDNRPTPDEVKRCGAWLDEELEVRAKDGTHSRTHVRVVLALGAIAWDAFLDHLARARGVQIPKPRPKFAHGAMIDSGRDDVPILVGSYHVSQQNTLTGRLTPAMFDRILSRVTQLATGRYSPAKLPGS